MKIHLHRSDRSTWCGRDTDTIARVGSGDIPSGHMTRDRNKASCKTCLKADAAEQRKEDAASG